MAEGADPDKVPNKVKLNPREMAKLKAQIKAQLIAQWTANDEVASDVAVTRTEASIAAEVVESQEKLSQTDQGKVIATPEKGKAVLAAPEKGEAVAEAEKGKAVVEVEKGKAIAAPEEDSVTIAFKPGEIVLTARRDQSRKAKILDWKESEPGMIKYYVHYIGCDDRLNEWVSWIRLSKLIPSDDSSSPMKKPLIDPITPTGVGSDTPDSKGTPTRPVTRLTRRLNYNIPESTKINMSALDQSLKKEHKNETKIKNIQVIWFGKYEIETWYYSPYPKEYHQDRLYICEFCLKYMRKKKTIDEHKSYYEDISHNIILENGINLQVTHIVREKCAPKCPPGNEIYSWTTAPIDGQVRESEGTDLESTPRTSRTKSSSSKNEQHRSVYEVDGSKNKLYCQFLCLLAGLFLDQKAAFYTDIDCFLFYILTENDAFGKHLVAYFSKEKDSKENIACILTLPPFQRKWYGQFLIAFAYTLSRKEGKVGTPERPLSDLGEKSFTNYWKRVLLETIRDHRDASLEDLIKWTSVRREDVISTLQPLKLVKYWRGSFVPDVDTRGLNSHLKKLESQPDWLKIDIDKLNWPFVPPIAPSPKSHTPRQLRPRPVRPSP